MQKNVSGQKWVVFAFDETDNTPVTGDAANITANLRIDGGAANAVDDTNPTELEDGYYIFDLTQAETNGNLILICPESSTADVQVVGVPGAVWTTPQNFNALGIESDGDLTKVNELDMLDIDSNGYVPVDVFHMQSNVITADAIHDDAEYTPEEIATQVRIEMDNNSTQLATIAADTNELQTDDIPGTLSTIEGKIDTIDGIVDDILVDTAEIGAAGAGLTEAGGTGDHLTALPWNASWDAEVQSECTDALNAYDPPTATEMTSAFTEIKGATWDSGTDTLEAIRNKETDIETDTQDLQTQIGTDGAGLTNMPWNASWDAEVQSEVNDALVALNLDHLCAVADADDVVDNSIIAKLASSDGDWSGFDNTGDSLEAIRDRGDVAWITGGGGSITQILNVQPLIPQSIDLADTATVRVGLMLFNAVDDLPTTAEITPGTISIDRKGIGGTSWSSIVSDAACSEADGVIYYDEVFDSGTGYAEGDTIRITLKSQSITADANTFEVTGSGGVIFYTEIRQTMRGTNSASTFDPASDTVARVTLVDTCTTNTDMRGTDSAYTGTPPTAASIRAEIDSNSTQLAAIVEDTGTTIPAQISGLNDISVADIYSYAVEGTFTMLNYIRVMLSGMAGLSSGGGTTSLAFRDQADSKDRISATVDANGNRTVMTLDGD